MLTRICSFSYVRCSKGNLSFNLTMCDNKKTKMELSFVLTRNLNKRPIEISNDVHENNRLIIKITSCQMQRFDKPIFHCIFQIKELMNFCTLNEGIKYLFDSFSDLVGWLVSDERGCQNRWYCKWIFGTPNKPNRWRQKWKPRTTNKSTDSKNVRLVVIALFWTSMRLWYIMKKMKKGKLEKCIFDRILRNFLMNCVTFITWLSLQLLCKNTPIQF